MPIKEAEQFLPGGDIDLTQVYQMVIRQNPALAKTKEEIINQDIDTVTKAASDFLTASIAYFANRGHDPYMQRLGEFTWRSVNKGLVLAFYTSNVQQTMIELGLSIKDAMTINPDEVYCACITTRNKNQILTNPYILIPPAFLVRVQKNPIEALATTAMISSLARDYLNRRVFIDPDNILPRAHATEAHFLIYASKANPTYAPQGYYRGLIQKYPLGINSLDKEMLYVDLPFFTDYRNN